jgi:flagellar basal body-associated protein FliL
MEDQAEQHRKWWLKNKRLLIITIITIIAILIAFILLVYWFGWDWTGFNSGVSKITIISTSRGTTTTTEMQPAKSLWDWLQLLGILAIPVVVGLGTVLFTTQQAHESDKNREKRHQTDLEIAEKNREREQETAIKIAADNQHEAAFRAYIDKMSELLIERRLAHSAPDDRLRNVARIQTLAVLIGFS